MKPYQCIEVLQNKLNCVNKNKCNKKCKECNYYVDDEALVEALKYAVTILNHQKQIKNEFFNSGIEYAKNEFAKRIEREMRTVGDRHMAKEIDDLRYLQVLGLQRAVEISGELSSE